MNKFNLVDVHRTQYLANGKSPIFGNLKTYIEVNYRSKCYGRISDQRGNKGRALTIAI